MTLIATPDTTTGANDPTPRELDAEIENDGELRA